MSKYDEAVTALDKATTMNPNVPDAWNIKGNVLVKMARYDDALKSYDKALAIEPTFAGAVYNRGCAYSLKGDGPKPFWN